MGYASISAYAALSMLFASCCGLILDKIVAKTQQIAFCLS